MLDERRLTVELPNGILVIGKDVHRKGVLTSLLWWLVVNSTLVQLNSPGYYTVGYPDDLTIYIISEGEL